MAKKTINKTKRQPIEWDTISANNVTDKVLISKMYKQFKQLNIKKNQKMGRRPEETFFQRTYTYGR